MEFRVTCVHPQAKIEENREEIAGKEEAVAAEMEKHQVKMDEAMPYFKQVRPSQDPPDMPAWGQKLIWSSGGARRSSRS